MAVARGRAPSIGLEALDLFSRWDAPTPGTSTTVRDSGRLQGFQDAISAGLIESLDNPSRLHGWRVQGLFEAMIVGLGNVRLIKEEDTGGYYYDDSNGAIRLPDFRVVRADGEHLLIEVKAVDPRRVTKPHRIRTADLDEMQRYAHLAGARLMVAHYWSAANLWTVVDATVLTREESYSSLTLIDAAMVNELGLLGDAEIGTKPPLVFTLIADDSPQTREPVSADESRIGFTVGGIEFASAARPLTDPVEQRIAWFLMMHGRWRTTVASDIIDGRLERVHFICEPEGDEEDAEIVRRQGFAIVGSLSSMYSALYNEATLTDEGDLRALRHAPDPDSLATLIPETYWQRPDRVLPIWKLVIQPNRDHQAGLT